jgi:sortase A
MGNRSDRRIFRRRRRNAGFVLFASLGILLLGVVLFSSIFAAEEAADSSSVDRIETPAFASAPDAVEQVVVEEQPDQAMADQEAAAKDKAAEDQAAEDQAAKDKAAEEKKAEEGAAAQAEAKPAGPPPPQDKTMSLTVPKMELYDNVVYNSSDPTTLDVGAAKLEESGFPWQESANPYISAHRLGWPGTASYYQFYNLPLMVYGDPIYLTDANGTTYTYEVTEIYEVAPSEVWVSEPVAGQDMISLQTCTEDYGDYWTMGPDWATRYVVRGQRVDVSYA